MTIDWDALWALIEDGFAMGAASIHGPSHWRRVEGHAVRLAEANSGDVLVVRLFAVFHDACRINDSRDDGHGVRGAELAAQLRDQVFTLPDAQFALLQDACRRHTDGLVTDDPTIGACWDADRLDLWRVEYQPRIELFSTKAARNLILAVHYGPKYSPTLK